MAPLQNLFALIETEEEDVSAIALAAAIKADQQKPTPKIEAHTKPSNVHNSMMTKPNRHSLPNGWRPQRQCTNKYQERHSNYRKQTENQLSDANGNGKFNNGAKPYIQYTNNGRNHGQTNGFQGNFRRSFGGPNGYHGNRRGYGRNRRYPANNLQGNNGQKKEVVVDADGWQVYVGRHGRKSGEITPENQSQSGRNEVQYKEMDRSSVNGGESEKLDHSGVEAGSIAAAEGDRESRGSVSSRESWKQRSGKGKNEEGQDDSKLVKKAEEEYKAVFTLKEYEEAQLEKRKALESIKQAEQRKVTLDKDFESMLVLDKRDDDNDKPNWEREAEAKKKESINKGGKITKVMNVDELWKAANCIEERKRMRMLERLKRIKGEDKEEEESKSQKSNAQIAAAEFIADANQFPALSALH